MFDFEIYWDDSGTHTQSPIAVAACYVATKQQWDLAVKEWDATAVAEGFDTFHMADFMLHPKCGLKPFCDWDEVKRDRVYYRLASIINTRVRMGCSMAVPKDHYDAYIPQQVKADLGREHFTFAVRSVLDWVKQWHKRYAEGKKVQYVFDFMSRGKGEIMQVFDFLGERPEMAQELGYVPSDPDGVSLQKKELFKPLQAADILAWNTYNFMQEEISRGLPDKPAPLHPYFDVLWRNRPMQVGFYREGDLRDAGSGLLDHEEREGQPG